MSGAQTGMLPPAKVATAFRAVGAALDSYGESTPLSGGLADLQSSLRELPQKGIIAADLQGVILEQLAAQEGAVHNVLQAYNLGSAAAIGASVDLGAEWAWIPPGEFMMGSPENDRYAHSDEKPLRRVMVGGFWMLKRLVSNAEYAAFLKATDRSDERKLSGKFAAPDHPAVYVTQGESMAYAQWLGKKVAEQSGVSVIGSLPSEAQWEKAAKGPNGDEFITPATRAQAYFNVSATRAVNATDAYANGYGLFDVIGNVWEWTSSKYGDGTSMVLRGGSWCNDVPRSLLAAFRRGSRPDRRDDVIGLRPVVALQDS